MSRSKRNMHMNGIYKAKFFIPTAGLPTVAAEHNVYIGDIQLF
jgi:hypothetical protein